MIADYDEEGTTLNNIREGLIPTVLGTAVTAAGYAMAQNRRIDPMISNTVFGFGLAHVVLGAIDLMEHRR
ncbi:MAG TPA: asparagine synthase [Bacillus sp. (in: firmicutes)]|nr:asparagine synthase [Bacillus sp. (in: firmicutes)]